MDGQILLLWCQMLVGLLFGWSALQKARDVAAFTEAIGGFGLIPAALNRLAAWALLTSESAVVIMLLAGGVLTGWAFGLAILLLTAFSGALVTALRRQARIRCNCFGKSAETISWYDVVRNVGIIGCAAAGLWLHSRLPAQSATLSSMEAMLVAVMAVTVALLITHLSLIVLAIRLRPMIRPEDA